MGQPGLDVSFRLLMQVAKTTPAASRAEIERLSMEIMKEPELRTKLPGRVAIWAGGSAPVLRRRTIDGVMPLTTLETVAAAVAAWRVVQPPAS